LYYTGLDLDRASASRADPVWLQQLQARPDRQVLPLWRDQCLVRAGQPVTELKTAADELVFLGLAEGQAPVFAADLSALDRQAALERAGADDTADVRTMIADLSPAQAGLLAYARGLLYWQRAQQFCGWCGGRCDARNGGHLRCCRDCDREHFPKIEPAIIVLVELPGEPRRCLLGRHQGAVPDRFSTLAGFVEIGESLEDAVRREVAEEAGVSVGAVRYQGSQAWPFPAGIMVGFRAEAESDHIGADGAELLEARWFTAADLRDRLGARPFPPYRVDSIGRVLIEGWLAEVTAVR
jgi:NAD+ diphosphatase